MGELQAIEVRVADPLKMAWYELSDLGNAERLRDRAGGKLLFVEDRWLAYDGQRWSGEDGKRLAHRKAHEVARGIVAEAQALQAETKALIDKHEIDRDEMDRRTEKCAALYKHAVMSGNANKTAAMLAQAQNLLFAARDDFDRDPLAINVQNGTLRLFHAQGKWCVRIDPHDPADMLSRLAEVAWDADATAPAWETHMATVLPVKPVRAFFQRCVGYGLSGSIDEQSIFLLQGKGGDGKSTTMNVLREIMGGYGSAADVQTFIAGAMRSGGDATPDLARLAGDTRLVSTGEPKIGAALDEARIKQVTGGSPVTARELHGTPFEYLPRFKVFFECNRKPRISGDDDGIWRRVIVIQFPHQFKGTAIDKRAQRRLSDEGPGILRWAIDGALAWLEAGALSPPTVVQEAIEDYRRASNPFGEWFGDSVDTSDPDARVLSADLYASYKTFCEDNGVGDREVMTSTGFGRALGDKQLPKRKGADGRVLRVGARLRAKDDLIGTGGDTDVHGEEAQAPTSFEPGDPASGFDD